MSSTKDESVAVSGDVSTEKNLNVLIGCTGSVASLKLPKIVEELKASNKQVSVRVVATDHAFHFFDRSSVLAEIFCDEDEWKMWNGRNDPVLHIELRRWADVYVIAPLDANTLGKIASGICDNLVTCVVRAWDAKKPLLFAPAMNTLMWQHPITAEQVDRLRNWGYEEIPCVEKLLVCGEQGNGAMAEVSTIVQRINSHLQRINS